MKYTYKLLIRNVKLTKTTRRGTLLGQFIHYLQTAVAHAEAHGIHVDVVRQSRPRRFAIILRKLFHKRRWSALVFEN